MSWWDEFKPRVEQDAPLGRLTWFRVGGNARFLFHPRDARDLAALMHRAREEELPVKVLGGGANVLIRDDGFDGVVVRLDQPEFRAVRVEGESVEAGAGVDLMPLTRRLSYEGLSGVEPLAGIPGTVGGGVRMNAGGPAGSLGDVVREATVLDPEGMVETRSTEQLGFGYRSSDLEDCVVLSVRMELRQGDPQRCRAEYDERLAGKTGSQPLRDKSAGCVFKNPAEAPAGRLIDQAGLKGTRCGQAVVSDRHANFILAESGATASDVLRLIDLIRARVRERFGVELETEIDIW